MDFRAFCASRGVDFIYSEPGLHCGAAHVSRRARKAQIKVLSERLLANAEAIAKCRSAYEILVSEGKVSQLDRRTRLEIAASGHPDNESTKAAKRLLTRDYGVVW